MAVSLGKTWAGRGEGRGAESEKGAPVLCSNLASFPFWILLLLISPRGYAVSGVKVRTTFCAQVSEMLSTRPNQSGNLLAHVTKKFRGRVESVLVLPQVGNLSL